MPGDQEQMVCCYILPTQLTSSLVLSSFPQLDSYEHYTTVALDGASGDVRWQHTPSDFQLNPAYRPVRLPQTEAKHCSIKYC